MRSLILTAAMLVPAVAHAAEDFRPLSKDDVTLVQTFMYDIMGVVLQGPPDGVMGPKSRAALAMLQGDIGAPQTGYVTADQFEMMKELVAEGPPEDRQWAAISVKAGDSQTFFVVSGYKVGSEAYRDAEAQCKANPDGTECITGVTYGTKSKPAWVAAMQCVHEQVGYAAVWFGATKQDAYENVEKQLDAMGVTKSDRCFRVASIKSDGTK